MSGIIIDHEKCILCRKCLRSCPVSALELADGRICVKDLCNLCTMCVDACPKGAISLASAAAASDDRSSGIWLYAQVSESGLSKVSCELASKAAELAADAKARSGELCEVTALLPAGDADMAAELISCGADSVLYCDHAYLRTGDPDAAAATMVWSYIGELAFNMLVLVGTVKAADTIVKEMMGL